MATRLVSAVSFSINMSLSPAGYPSYGHQIGLCCFFLYQYVSLSRWLPIIWPPDWSLLFLSLSICLSLPLATHHMATRLVSAVSFSINMSLSPAGYPSYGHQIGLCCFFLYQYVSLSRWLPIIWTPDWSLLFLSQYVSLSRWLPIIWTPDWSLLFLSLSICLSLPLATHHMDTRLVSAVSLSICLSLPLATHHMDTRLVSAVSFSINMSLSPAGYPSYGHQIGLCCFFLYQYVSLSRWLPIIWTPDWSLLFLSQYVSLPLATHHMATRLVSAVSFSINMSLSPAGYPSYGHQIGLCCFSLNMSLSPAGYPSYGHQIGLCCFFLSQYVSLSRWLPIIWPPDWSLLFLSLSICLSLPLATHHMATRLVSAVSFSINMSLSPAGYPSYGHQIGLCCFSLNMSLSPAGYPSYGHQIGLCCFFLYQYVSLPLATHHMDTRLVSAVSLSICLSLPLATHHMDTRLVSAVSFSLNMSLSPAGYPSYGHQIGLCCFFLYQYVSLSRWLPIIWPPDWSLLFLSLSICLSLPLATHHMDTRLVSAVSLSINMSLSPAGYPSYGHQIGLCCFFLYQYVSLSRWLPIIWTPDWSLLFLSLSICLSLSRWLPIIWTPDWSLLFLSLSICLSLPLATHHMDTRLVSAVSLSINMSLSPAGYPSYGHQIGLCCFFLYQYVSLSRWLPIIWTPDWSLLFLSLSICLSLPLATHHMDTRLVSAVSLSINMSLSPAGYPSYGHQIGLCCFFLYQYVSLSRWLPIIWTPDWSLLFLSLSICISLPLATHHMDTRLVSAVSLSINMSLSPAGYPSYGHQIGLCCFFLYQYVSLSRWLPIIWTPDWSLLFLSLSICLSLPLATHHMDTRLVSAVSLSFPLHYPICGFNDSGIRISIEITDPKLNPFELLYLYY